MAGIRRSRDRPGMIRWRRGGATPGPRPVRNGAALNHVAPGGPRRGSGSQRGHRRRGTACPHPRGIIRVRNAYCRPSRRRRCIPADHQGQPSPRHGATEATVLGRTAFRASAAAGLDGVRDLMPSRSAIPRQLTGGSVSRSSDRPRRGSLRVRRGMMATFASGSGRSSVNLQVSEGNEGSFRQSVSCHGEQDGRGCAVSRDRCTSGARQRLLRHPGGGGGVHRSPGPVPGLPGTGEAHA